MDRLYWIWVDWREINYIIAVLEKRNGKYHERKKYIYNYWNQLFDELGINQFIFHIIYIYIYIYCYNKYTLMLIIIFCL